MTRASADSRLPRSHLTPSDLSANVGQPYNAFREQDEPPDAPLDAFDKELLAAEPAEDRSWQAPQGRGRISLPPKPFLTPRNPSTMRQDMRDELHATPRRRNAASSSPGQNISSPTVVALSQRHDHGHNVVSNLSFDHDRSSPLPRKDAASLSVPVQASYRISQPASKIQLGHAPPVVQGIPLVSVNDMPDRLRSLFSFPLFNAVQSRCFGTAFKTNENLVLSAPTGSGKTVVMELAICHLMQAARNEEFKIVYQAPTRALCAERCADWQSKFGPLDLQCAELTGDTDANQMCHVQAANIIVTTPEKWDSITRRWKDHAKLMRLIRLFLIDEVHILKESRGATLEAVVSRMKSTETSIRFIALSATIPNSDDVAMWLGKDSIHPNLPAHREVFGQEFRPVQLQKIVYGYPGKSNDFFFDSILETKLPEIIAKHSQKKPIIIFCPFRKSCVKTAKMLAQLWTSTIPPDRLWSGPTRAPGILDNDLRQYVSAGVAFHHAGLDISDRRAVEQGFLSRNISIICCTSTLAVGVNLPCYLVIIKGTKGWTDNGCQEYADLEMMQMLGRAGRPQFEQSACTVILTQNERVDYYNRLGSGHEPLESCLHINLLDHLNAEIGLGTVSDLVSAKRWLSSTFLFVRLSKNANHYRLKEDVTSRNDDELSGQICSKDVTLLQEADLVTREAKLDCTEFGHVMARYSVKFDTMKILLSLPPRAKLSEIISIIAQAAEFRDLRLRGGEKSFYKQVNKDVGMKFPILVDIALPAHKVSLLLQAELGGVECPAGEQFVKHKNRFQQDKAMIFQHVNRLVRCVVDCQLIRGDSKSARHALELARSFAARVWDNSPLQLKQLDQIGNVAVRKLASAGIKSIESLENTEAHRIETVIGRGPPFGIKLLSKLAQFPKLRVLVKLAGKEMKPQRYIEIRLKAEIGFLNENIPAFFRRRPIYVCFLAETSDGQIIDFRRIPASKLQNDHEILLSTKLTKPSQYISCHVMCDEIAGTCRSAELRPNLPASLFPTSTEQNESGPKFKSSNKDLSCGQLQEAGRKRKRSEDFDDGGLDDGDMLAAESVEIMDIDVFENELACLPSRTNQPNHKKGGNLKKQRWDEDGGEPVRLTNGKWACNHKCKDKVNCKHMCCRDGLDKPPKPAKKSISGKIEEHLSMPSILDVINNTPSKAHNESKGSSSEHRSPKQHRPTPATKETRGLISLHTATTPTAPIPVLKSTGVKPQMEQTNLQQYSTAADASSKRNDQNPFDEDAFDSDWINDIDAKSHEVFAKLRDSSKVDSETLVTTGPNDSNSQNNPLLDADDSQFEFDENEASMLEASLVGLEDSVRLNNCSTTGQNDDKDPDANASVSSGTVCELSSSRANRSQAEDPFDCDDGIYDLGLEEPGEPDGDPPHSPHAAAYLRIQYPSCRNEHSTSPSKKVLFLSPERGQFAPPDAPSDDTACKQQHEAGTATPNVKVRAPFQEILNDRALDRILDKSEHRIGGEIGRADEDAALKKRREDEGKLWKDGIDPLFYNEFKDIVEFI